GVCADIAAVVQRTEFLAVFCRPCFREQLAIRPPGAVGPSAGRYASAARRLAKEARVKFGHLVLALLDGLGCTCQMFAGHRHVTNAIIEFNAASAFHAVLAAAWW